MAATETKKLIVDFSSHQPKFEFLGSWTGKDLRILLTHARRAYFLHNKAIRTQNPREEDPRDVEMAHAGVPDASSGNPNVRKASRKPKETTK